MLNGKYIPSQEIIREAYRDKRYSYELPWQDAIEWIVDAIELIGAPSALMPRQACIRIENYRGMLDCDIHTVMQVAGSFNGCSPFPMVTSTNTFHPVYTCADEQINPELLDQANITTDNTVPIGEDISGNPVYTFQNGNMSMPETITDTSGRTPVNHATYTLNDNFIFTNFETGYVFIAYKGFPVDKEGFPLIPDNRSYKEAVKAYICQKIDYILWRTGELEKAHFDYSEKEWLWYVGKAGNAARMPNYDGMQALMQQIKLIPRKYAHDEYFKNLGNK